MSLALALADLAERPAAYPRLKLLAGGASRAVAEERLAALDRLAGRITRYASGLSRANDFVAAAWSGHGVGVEIGEVSAPALLELARVIVDYKAPCFVDSGAFGAFKRRFRDAAAVPPIDFDVVHQGYDRLQLAIGEINIAEERIPPPLFVMPDVVGDQHASLALARRHRTYIAATIAFSGVSRALIPLHTGSLSLSHAYDHLVNLLGSDAWTVGVPSNAVAVAPQAFIEFLQTSRPRAVHILGAMANSRLQPRLAQIVASGLADDIEVSADANPLRSAIIERGQGASGRRQALARELGGRGRRDELVNYVNAAGGLAALRAAYRRADAPRRARILGLLTELGGQGEGEVLGRFALDEPAFYRPPVPFAGMRA
jgi:hypothetical protein